MGYKYIFGPVNSRRLGLSLGIDLFEHNHCNFNCVYCECGRTDHTGFFSNKELIKKIIEELKDIIKRKIKFNVITFAGKGEPLLFENIDILIDEIKKITNKKIVVLTNGALLYYKKIRKRIYNADIVKASFDAGDNIVLKKINRPLTFISVDKIKKGIREFLNEYKNEFWIEILFVKNFNDSIKHLKKIKRFLNSIKVDKIQIGTIHRIPAEKTAIALTEEELIFIKQFLNIENIEIMGSAKNKYKVLNAQQLLDIQKRRRMTISQIKEIADEKVFKEFLKLYK